MAKDPADAEDLIECLQGRLARATRRDINPA
jgi:hypothetical protein